MLCCTCALIVSVSLVSLVQHFLSGKFDPDYRSPVANYSTYGPNWQFDKGKFDLGAWSCQLSTSEYDSRHSYFSRQCIDETAALWSDLILGLSLLGMAVTIWRDSRGQRMLVRDYQDLNADYELYNS
jgi:hypothetical protein